MELLTLLEMREKAAAKPTAKNLPFSEWLPHATPVFVWSWSYQVLIQRHIQMILNSQIDRLILTVPPRHGKSEMVTVRLPVYCMERDETFRAIVGAYSQSLARKFSRKSRKLARERGVKLSREASNVDDWETETSAPVPGGLRAAGVGVGITGMGANGGIVDDPVKNRKEANSEVYREAVWDWYRDDLSTRLEPGAFLIVIMTRWHEDDMAGRLIREEGAIDEGGQWTVINLPALAEIGDLLDRPEGAALCPERYDEVALDRIKQTLGDSFNALYQGRPSAATGNIVKRKWFHYYGARPSANVTLEIVQSWDTASKGDQQGSAYSVCTTWAVTRVGAYLLDVYRERLNYPDLKRAAASLASKWEPGTVLIEDKSTGQSLIQELRSETSVPVVSIEPEGDKITRMVVESSAYESGWVYHPEGEPWLADYESELAGFPFAPAADQVDSTSQFLKWARKRMWNFNMISSGNRTKDMDGYGGDDMGGWGSLLSDNMR